MKRLTQFMAGHWYVLALLVLFTSGCQDNSSSSDGDSDLTVTPNPSANQTTSYEQGKTDMYIQRFKPFVDNQIEAPPFIHAISYYDFDGNGTTDLFMAPGTGNDSETEVLLFSNEGNNTFDLVSDDAGTTVFGGTPPGLIHARKSITGDFDGNGKQDLFVVGHGFDQPPFPGEHPILILSKNNVLDTVIELTDYTGFFHAAASADIDNDGDIDILVADNEQPFFLINDGSANFTRNIDRLPVEAKNSSFFTAELIDIDDDGFIDMFAAGHEFEEMPSVILWGNETGKYTMDNATILPEVAGYETILDFEAEDLDGDGNRELVLNRTGSPPDFYIGFYIQLLDGTGNRSYTDVSTSNIDGYSESTGPNLGEFNTNWFDWIRTQDFDNDGDLDILVDDKDRSMGWNNDGSGSFIREVNFN